MIEWMQEGEVKVGEGASQMVAIRHKGGETITEKATLKVGEVIAGPRAVPGTWKLEGLGGCRSKKKSWKDQIDT